MLFTDEVDDVFTVRSQELAVDNFVPFRVAVRIELVVAGVGVDD